MPVRSLILPITLLCDFRLGRLLLLPDASWLPPPINDRDDEEFFNKSFCDGRRGNEFD